MSDRLDDDGCLADALFSMTDCGGTASVLGIHCLHPARNSQCSRTFQQTSALVGRLAVGIAKYAEDIMGREKKKGAEIIPLWMDRRIALLIKEYFWHFRSSQLIAAQ
jgi:hypothetical protein